MECFTPVAAARFLLLRALRGFGAAVSWRTCLMADRSCPSSSCLCCAKISRFSCLRLCEATMGSAHGVGKGVGEDRSVVVYAVRAAQAAGDDGSNGGGGSSRGKVAAAPCAPP